MAAKPKVVPGTRGQVVIPPPKPKPKPYSTPKGQPTVKKGTVTADLSCYSRSKPT